MGLTVDITVQPKYNGKLYHELTLEEKERFGEVFHKSNSDLGCVFEGERNWNFVRIIRATFPIISDSEDDGEIWAYVDKNTIEDVIYKLKRHIDIFHNVIDRYSKYSYGNESELYNYCEILEIVENFKNNNDLDKEYLLVWAGW